MSSKLQNSIWPNTDGNLGNIKVQIPTGIGDDKWPEGDALVHNFVYKNGKLVGFVDTKALTVNDSKSTTIDYDYFDIELPFTEDEITIIRGARNKFFNVRYNPINDDNVIVTIKYKGCKTVEDIKAVDPDYLTNDIIDGVWKEGLGDLEKGYYVEIDDEWFVPKEVYYGVFHDCTNLTSFSSDLSSLTDGKDMFDGCTNLESFSSDLSSLTNGFTMFYRCTNLTSFTSDLSGLTSGDSMFTFCSNLTSFNYDLPSLTNGYGMFYYCTKLTSFNSDLSGLKNGERMFESCKNLTSFSSDLSSLTNGYDMFRDCKLDTASVQNIADTINTASSGTIHIGIGNSAPNSQEEETFNTIASKGWTVYVNGSKYTPTSPAAITTLDENGEETTTPIPFWAKPVPSDEEHAQYADEQGNFYNILGAQFIYGDDLSTYGMFTCEEDAAANMRLTKINEKEIKTA